VYAVPESQPRKESEGLSLQTLVIAAVASGVAAITVSHLWKGGTVLAASMTPVIVALVKEALDRPMKSEVVRRSATSARRAVAGTAAARTEAARQKSPYPGAIPTPPPPPPGAHGADGDLTQGDVLLTHPRRTYGGGGAPRRRLHVKLAIVTGLLAFVIAAAVLTVPELVFGGAVSSGHRTTIFGGGSTSAKKSNTDQQKTNTTPQQSTQPSQTTPQSTTPQATPTQPQQSPSQPQPAPQQPPSGGGATPAPQSPAPSSPTP
jgi:hypothetical protein